MLALGVEKIERAARGTGGSRLTYHPPPAGTTYEESLGSTLMVAVFAICPTHGTILVSGIVGGTGSITFESSQTPCPVSGCNKFAQIVDGTYELVGSVVRAFRAAGASLQTAESLKRVATSLQDGSLSREEALEVGRSISPLFGEVLEKANQNAPLLTVLVMFLALLVQVYQARSSDSSSDQQHADAIAQIEKFDQQHADDQAQQEAQQKLYELLLKRQSGKEGIGTEGQSVSKELRTRPVQKPRMGATVNRHQRRKAAALARKSHEPR